jgi:hypothetical protein
MASRPKHKTRRKNLKRWTHGSIQEQIVRAYILAGWNFAASNGTEADWVRTARKWTALVVNDELAAGRGLTMEGLTDTIIRDAVRGCARTAGRPARGVTGDRIEMLRRVLRAVGALTGGIEATEKMLKRRMGGDRRALVAAIRETQEASRDVP